MFGTLGQSLANTAIVAEQNATLLMGAYNAHSEDVYNLHLKQNPMVSHILHQKLLVDYAPKNISNSLYGIIFGESI